jgi:hypothetical protein
MAHIVRFLSSTSACFIPGCYHGIKWLVILCRRGIHTGRSDDTLDLKSILRPLFLGLLFLAPLVGGCSGNRYRVVISTDTAWPLGESRTCALTRPRMTLFCFLVPRKAANNDTRIEELSTLSNLTVTANFDEPVDWSEVEKTFNPSKPLVFDQSCRLDSNEHATCTHTVPIRNRVSE